MVSASVQAFIDLHSAQTWDWGVVDGALMPFDWLVHDGKPDYAFWRGSYSSELGLRSIITRRGGLTPLLNDSCSRGGLMPLEAAIAGAIGVVGTHENQVTQSAALYDGEKWLARTPAGFEVVLEPLLCMWAS